MIKNITILEKARKKKVLLVGILDTTAPTGMSQASSLIDFDKKYNWAMSNADLDVVKKLGLTSIKKYWRRVGQIKIEFDWLYD